jgi:hypothetical protein
MSAKIAERQLEAYLTPNALADSVADPRPDPDLVKVTASIRDMRRRIDWVFHAHREGIEALDHSVNAF